MEQAQKEKLKRPISTETLPTYCRPNNLATYQIDDQHVYVSHDQLCDAIHERIIGAEMVSIDISALLLQDKTRDSSTSSST